MRFAVRNEIKKNGKWATDHYVELGVLAFSTASVMYTLGYLIRALKFRG